jgi:hypothetical protein
MSEEKKTPINLLLKYWPLIMVVISVIIMFANQSSSIENNTERITALELSDRASRDAQNQMLVQLSQIQTDIQWIKNQLK